MVYVYVHLPNKHQPTVGKYTIYMDGMSGNLSEKPINKFRVAKCDSKYPFRFWVNRKAVFSGVNWRLFVWKIILKMETPENQGGCNMTLPSLGFGLFCPGRLPRYPSLSKFLKNYLVRRCLVHIRYLEDY